MVEFKTLKELRRMTTEELRAEHKRLIIECKKRVGKRYRETKEEKELPEIIENWKTLKGVSW